FDLKKMGANSADFVHVVSEAMKLAFADRAYWLGDPDFAKVPRGLVSKDYAARLAAQIRLDRVLPGAEHGTPDRADEDVFEKHTTHFSTADAAGNWVACTATVNTSFGCKIVVPDTGVVLNNQMDDFSAQPGATNYFGLVGAEANAIAPGKRPLSSMSPTIVLKDGRPILSVGAAGGPTIISQTVLAIINTIDFGMSPESVSAKRCCANWKSAATN
ncbi:MAG: gamma-glutamyltransferase, partial [Verrucomicrobia bacterium]